VGFGGGLPLNATDAGGIGLAHAIPQQHDDLPISVGQPGVCHPPGVIAQFGRIAIPEAVLEHVVVKVAVDKPVA